MSVNGRKMNSVGSDSDSECVNLGVISRVSCSCWLTIDPFGSSARPLFVCATTTCYCFFYFDTVSCDGQFRPPPSDGTDSASSSEAFRFENKCSLANDLSFLAMMPEYCDVTFLVGENQQPMCGVKAILASRSR